MGDPPGEDLRQAEGRLGRRNVPAFALRGASATSACACFTDAAMGEVDQQPLLLVLHGADIPERAVEEEPRFQFSNVSASELDTDEGKPEREDKASGQGDNRDALPLPFASQGAAGEAAAAVSQAWQASTGQDPFTTRGLPEAAAGAKAEGFGSAIDETTWIATSVTHDVIPGVGWDTTVEVDFKPC